MQQRIGFILISALLMVGFTRSSIDEVIYQDEQEKTQFPAPVQQETLPDLSLIKRLIGDRDTIEAVVSTPIDDLFQVTAGAQVYYLSRDGRYMLQGDLLDLKQYKNLTETQRDQARLAVINRLNLSDLIIYPAVGQTRYTVTVFSDVDCPYCQMLFEQIDDFLKLGIELRFAAFPRTGIDSRSYYKAVSVWCAPDRKTTLLRAGRGLKHEKYSCESPVKESYDIGVKAGITGTPSFVFSDGFLISGFVSPENLMTMLQTHFSNK